MRNAIWPAAILFPASFFLSSAGRDVHRPNRFIVLVYAGPAWLTIGVIVPGVGLLTT